MSLVRSAMVGGLFVSTWLVVRCMPSPEDGNVVTPSALETADAADDATDAGAMSGQPYGGSWQPLATPAPFYPGEIALLTDGTLMVHATSTSDWWKLTPDQTGSYVDGSWSELATMPAGYAPTFFGLAVLPNGQVFVAGGEYNRGADAWTGLGALYDPVVDAWTPLEQPASWAENNFGIGDSPTVVLPNGVLMIGSVGTKNQALFDPRTLTFTITGNGKYDGNEEEGWTLLPNGKVLTVDVSAAPRTEIYDPSTGNWSPAGDTPMPVADKMAGEVGPAILLPNGSVFAMGATAHNAFYQSSSGMWSAGPDFPTSDAGQLDIADGPAVLLPNGNIMCVASVGDYKTPATFLEFDGVSFTPLSGIGNAVDDSSYSVMMIPLPSGQVLALDGSDDIEVFTPGGSPSPSWAPTITTSPPTVTRGGTYRLEGTQLNGLSQACSYGDDFQCATNYPLVRITNNATGDVFYVRTHDHSTMAVATGTQTVSTLFDVGTQVETGASTLVVAAGVPSAPAAVTVQ